MAKKDVYTNDEAVKLIESWCPAGATVHTINARDKWRIKIDGAVVVEITCTGWSDSTYDKWWIFGGKFAPRISRRSSYSTSFGNQQFKRRTLRVLMRNGAQYIRALSKAEALEAKRREHIGGLSRIQPYVEYEEGDKYLLYRAAVQGLVHESPYANQRVHAAVQYVEDQLGLELWKELLDMSYMMEIRNAQQSK